MKPVEFLKNRLSKSRDFLKDRLTGVFSKDLIDSEVWEGLEETLIMADVSIQTTGKIVENLQKKARQNKLSDPALLKDYLKEDILAMLRKYDLTDKDKHVVLLVVGVNGSGKTTSIGKLAKRVIEKNESVLLAAGDTFRAAATEQLEMIAGRIGAKMVGSRRGADPASVIFDSVSAGKNRDTDWIFVDTAGRLQSHEHLMKQLSKMHKIAKRETEGWGIVKTVLIIDATTGQNGLSQAKAFDEAIEIDCIILTKMDGTAKGGIILSIADEAGLPVSHIGVGEDPRDLVEFNPEDFVEALLGE